MAFRWRRRFAPSASIPPRSDRRRSIRDALGFVEIHIEQGPVLDNEGLHVAAVNRIVGQTRLSLEFAGQANHAGTTPMHLRRDALAGAAEWIAAVEAIASRTDGLVATVGRIALEPNAANVIPGKARVSLDVRHAARCRPRRGRRTAGREGQRHRCPARAGARMQPPDERARRVHG